MEKTITTLNKYDLVNVFVLKGTEIQMNFKTFLF